MAKRGIPRIKTRGEEALQTPPTREGDLQAAKDGPPHVAGHAYSVGRRRRDAVQSRPAGEMAHGAAEVGEGDAEGGEPDDGGVVAAEGGKGVVPGRVAALGIPVDGGLPVSDNREDGHHKGELGGDYIVAGKLAELDKNLAAGFELVGMGYSKNGAHYGTVLGHVEHEFAAAADSEIRRNAELLAGPLRDGQYLV